MKRLLFAAILLACAGAGPAPAADRPNVLLIVIDTLRRDHAGCCGYGKATTPTLDRLASEGALFDQAVASSCWTIPSVMSMFTSVSPSRHNLVTHERRAAEDLTTLAAELRKAGYRTAAVTSNPMTSGKLGFSRGFDLYDDFTIPLGVGLDFIDGEEPPPAVHRIVTSDKVTQLALRWIEKRDRDRPFFLHLLYFDPHYDYTPPPPYDRMFDQAGYAGKREGLGIKALAGVLLTPAERAHIAALYDGELRYADEQIGRLLEGIQGMGIEEDTLVIVMGDHGEEFWDHGGVAHGHTLYDELVAVPLAVRYPKRVKPGIAIREQVALLDVMPTVLDLLGLPVPAQCEGRSLRPLLEGKAGSPDRPAFMESEIEGELRAARTSTLKIVEKGGARELYALVEDPGEQHNLAGTARAAEFDALDRRLQDWKSRMQACRDTASAAPKPELDPKLLRQLRSLGYVK